MNTDLLQPRHLKLLPVHLLRQTIQEYREAMDVLSRNKSIDSQRLSTQFSEAIALIEEELSRRTRT